MTYSPATQQKVITQAADDFQRDGFCIIRGFFSPEQTRTMQEKVDHLMAHRLDGLPPESMFFQDKTDKRSLFRLEHMETLDPFFHDLFHGEQIGELVKKCLNDDIVATQMSMFGKAPRIGNPTPAHQDGNYFMLKPPHAAMVWIPVDRADRDNGCVCYQPGSHHQGMREHALGDAFGFSLGLKDTDQSLDAAKEVAAEVDPGDIIVHHCLTIHRTEGNPTDRLRRALGMTFFAASAKVDEQARQAHGQRVKARWKEQGRL